MEKQKSSGLIIVTIILMLLILVAGALLIYRYIDISKIKDLGITVEVGNQQNEEKDDVLVVEKKEEKQVQTFTGTDRPIAVMIDNHNKAWPQANLNKAYLVYEIVVEGGETRLMALFKGQELEKIGPIRSSRHYFLDYALENDAIYVHHGWSPQAQGDISKLRVNNINGMSESSKDFSRVKDKSAPHNMFTSSASLLKIAERKGYELTSSKKSVLNYVAEEFNLEDKYEVEVIEKVETEDVTTTSEVEPTEIIEEPKTVAKSAINVTIPHSKLQTVKYEYNAETKTYTRYARNKLQTDYITGEPVTTKNIIITMCDNYTLTDSENKGRQGLKNIGTFDGYYITNGKAIQIKCTKIDRDEQTIYKDLEGNEIQVNDGNTFINICPQNAKLVIE